ncbi:hypothetical protein BJY00DRAFT_319465 [Aspergillus carlsbadensis]|nr:hypothetical protein BJY00DRAFT_319465 [Aspergillus carlsbadensis]
MMRSNLYVFALAATRFAAAKQVGYFQAENCAAPSDFESCYADADEWLSDCINENCDALGRDCHDACECARQDAYTRCATSFCWNMVYSCEYQLQVSDAVGSCLNPDINSTPFWPPPDNANGRCNCNIGKISRALVLVNEAVGSCDDFVDAFSMTPDQIESIGNACLCCGLSGFLSPFYSFCPKLAPAELELEGFESAMDQLIPNLDWTQCSSWMNGYDCVSDFGYPADVKTYYGPGEFPADGTETLRNIGALTTPVSATATFVIAGEEVYVTAVSTDAAVPTGSSNSDDTDESSDSSDSTDSGDNNDSSDSGSDSSQSGSGDEEESNSDETPEDAAVRGMGVSAMLAGFAVVIAGLLVL